MIRGSQYGLSSKRSSKRELWTARAVSLAECLESLEAAEYGARDRVALEVWIDGCRDDGDSDDGDDDDDEARRRKTIDVARAFNFTHGDYRVHVRPQHVGVQVHQTRLTGHFWAHTWACLDLPEVDIFNLICQGTAAMRPLATSLL